MTDLFEKEPIIKSISYDQEEIIKWITKLYCPNGIELDPTYSKGNFYKNITPPKCKYDLIPQAEGVIEADCRQLPHDNNSVQSIMFDPPFVGGSRKNGKPGIIKTRFGYYKNVPLLWDMYCGALKEFYRILQPNGVLIFKCQDTIESGKQYLSHIAIYNMAEKIGFYAKDVFILLARARMMSPNMAKQKHARKYHSYFLVFIKQKNPIKYIGEDND